MDELYVLIISQSVAVVIALINSNRNNAKEEKLKIKEEILKIKEERFKVVEETKRLKLKNKVLELEIKEKEARNDN